MLWIFYGLPLVTPDSILVVTINGVGLAMEVAYITIFFIFAKKKSRIGNGLGALSGAVQLILYACYYKSTPTDDEDEDKKPPTELQLAGMSSPLVSSYRRVVHPDSTLVITINAIGLVMELIYLSIFWYYDHQNRGRKKVAIGLSGEVVFVAVVAIITMVAFHTHNSRSFFVGVICDVFNIIMYASPLTIVKKVITTGSVEYMPFYLSLAGFTNGCIWTAYALIKLDYFILISNGLGSLFGLVQLIIYGIHYRSTPQKGQDIVKPTEVQLSAASTA
ncbi:hypothetical protein Patl1_02725 [Pistacia atlantica]|uniref:Uncharacterized protein n=1 Tax=Pistacia atlantica TaxID=434234 RepID=A0ACC1CBY9_9ROSI|nr:hypothetical protein Patl1_02725 [Pistacia atlantica]